MPALTFRSWSPRIALFRVLREEAGSLRSVAPQRMSVARGGIEPPTFRFSAALPLARPLTISLVLKGSSTMLSHAEPSVTGVKGQKIGQKQLVALWVMRKGGPRSDVGAAPGGVVHEICMPGAGDERVSTGSRSLAAPLGRVTVTCTPQPRVRLRTRRRASPQQPRRPDISGIEDDHGDGHALDGWLPHSQSCAVGEAGLVSRGST